jgi:CRP-like cAMP-binding protein
VVNVGRRDSRSRVGHLLCEIGLRLQLAGLSDGRRYSMPMTQEQLADAAGLTAVHVNRVLKQLVAEGLIRRDKRMIEIPDWERLAAAADFNERYLHQQETAAA